MAANTHTGTKVFGNQMDFISSWMLIRGNNNEVSKNMFHVAFKEDSADCIVVCPSHRSHDTAAATNDGAASQTTARPWG